MSNSVKECPNRKSNIASCTCTYTSCGKRGMCCECISSHRTAGEIPGCLFTKDGELTYDRSYQNLVKTRKN